jgi:hypothetical protein
MSLIGYDGERLAWLYIRWCPRPPWLVVYLMLILVALADSLWFRGATTLNTILEMEGDVGGKSGGRQFRDDAGEIEDPERIILGAP